MQKVLLIFALIFQIGFWFETKDIKPDIHILPELPSKIEGNIMGDNQFMFRKYAMELQFAGDTFGRTTPLKDYDYKKLQKWLFLLDELDDKSHFTPSIASYYYSQTQNKQDVKYIVDYLLEHSKDDLQKNWWWWYQAVYLAKNKLNDKKTALKLAYKLKDVEGIPIWARQMPAFIHEELGENEEAYRVIKAIADSYEDLPQAEKNFMNYFIKERLDKIELE